MATTPAVTIKTETVLAHHVRVCAWYPASTRLRTMVFYSHRLRTVTGWAHVVPRVRCAMNGGTYNTSTLRPSGNVWAHGAAIRRNDANAPAVGFVRGHLYFGYANARRHGAVNVMNGLAYLVRNGQGVSSRTQAPWTTRAQFSCGPRGSDGWYGCFRSCAVQFKNGRVGLVEVSLASMPRASRILRAMGVVNAITFDSGGSAELATPGHGYPVGSTVGTPWHRLLPDDMIVQAIR